MTETEPTAKPMTHEEQAEYFYAKWERTHVELGDTINNLNAAYRERAHLVALLAAIYPSHIGPAPDTDPSWSIVYVQLPTGQASWHIARSDMPLFAHVPTSDPTKTHWDGHTTAEKYERIARLAADYAG